MNRKERLEELFREFPGIGPRQAKRFVYFLLWKSPNYIEELSKNISEIKKDVKKCQECNRFFDYKETNANICNICQNQSRENGKIMILEKNPDFENIEKMNIWDGKYFLIGKNLKITEKEPEQKINLFPLIKKIKDGRVKEIIFALSLNPEGEKTMDWIKEKLFELEKKYDLKIMELGRGLSLGTEVEYTDRITMEEALKHKRKI